MRQSPKVCRKYKKGESGMRIKYSTNEVSDEYKCDECGTTGVRLWREYQTMFPALFCVECARKKQGMSQEELNLKQTYTDQIGWLVPAVPDEEGVGYWGYTSVPQEGVDWWKRLPLSLFGK